jgi:iron-sulfur cluster assembly accessory protein
MQRVAARSMRTPGLTGLTQRFASTMMKRRLLGQQPTPVQTRNMVMITQTKSADLPKDVPDDADADAAPAVGNVNYNYLSYELNVTPSCLQRIENLVKQRDDSNYFLRVYVDAGGCSGFQYMFEVDKEIDEDEDMIVVEDADSKFPRVVVDETSLGYMKGSTLDYVQEMIKSSFVVAENPQSESACGCGSSFAMKNFASNPALD